MEVTTPSSAWDGDDNRRRRWVDSDMVLANSLDLVAKARQRQNAGEYPVERIKGLQTAVPTREGQAREGRTGKSPKRDLSDNLSIHLAGKQHNVWYERPSFRLQDSQSRKRKLERLVRSKILAEYGADASEKRYLAFGI